MTENNNLHDFGDFLGSTYHQDMGSPEDATYEVIYTYNDEQKKHIIQMINIFIISSMSNEEKTKFIEDNTDIYFPAIEMEPLEWITQLKYEIEKSLGM